MAQDSDLRALTGGWRRREARILLLQAVVTVAAVVVVVLRSPANPPPVFAGADQAGVIFGYPHVRVGQPVWLGLPVMTVVSEGSIQIVSARLVGHWPVTRPEFFDAPPYGAKGARHVTILPQDQFEQYAFQTDGPLVGTMFSPGPPTHYGLLRLVFNSPGHYVITTVVLHYVNAAGRDQSQRVLQTFDLRVS